MADEFRRSARATKGQHTKMDQEVPTSEKKKRGKKGKKAAAEEEGEEEESIRCVCGVTTDDGSGMAWIACDNCGVWQHNVCVGVSTFEDEIPKNYLCEQCDEEFHKDLLDAVARGEQPWEDRKREHNKMMELEAKEPKKRGRGRGKAKRISDPDEFTEAANGKANTPSTPVPDTKKKEALAKGGSSKRKVRDDSQDTASAKVQKTSASHVTPKQKSPLSDLPTKILDIDQQHQGPAKLILKSLSVVIPVAVNEGVYTYSPGDTPKAKAERLAVEIEDAISKAHPDFKSGYKEQLRAIAANLKQNQELCNGLLARTLTPATLAVMTSDDMASKELKQETAKMKAKADKASIMVTEDDGPRIRRTHKGDEIVGGDNFTASSDTPVSRQRRRSMLDPNADMAARSRENSPGNNMDIPDNIADGPSGDIIRGGPHAPGAPFPKPPMKVETRQPPMRKSSTQNFDYNNIISKVAASPTGPAHPSHIRRASINVTQSSGPGDDPDIDRLLEEDGNESPPYSPAEYDSDPEIIWRGMVTMDSIAKFPGVAKWVGGADLTRAPNPIQWDDVLQKDLRIAGRIDHDKANEYLCSLRYSPPTDVVVVDVTPTGEAAMERFKVMFDYFDSKGRYGVLTNKGIGNIRDTYLVPVPASPGRLPDFLVNLEGHKVPEDRLLPKILVALVIRNQWEEHQHRSFDGVDAQSPSLQNHPVRQLSMSGPVPAMSPIAPQNAAFPNNAPPHLAHPPPQLTPEEMQERQDQERAQREGEDVARRILGPHVQAPTVSFLMPQAYQMRIVEWEVIRGILESDDRSRIDLTHLSQVLEHRMSQQPQLQQPNQQHQAPPPPNHPSQPPPLVANPPA